MGSLSVLLVEDVPADAQLVELAFAETKAAVTVVHAGDGCEALDMLRGREGLPPLQPNLILLDLNMPRMDGREFLRAAKEDDVLRSFPVVVLTTSDAERDISTAYRLGAAGYIVKPMEVDDLIDQMDTLIHYWGGVVRLPPPEYV